MPRTRLLSRLALCAFLLLLSSEAGAEPAAMICMWPDGRPTKVVIDYDAATVTWSNGDRATAKITNEAVSWEVPGKANFIFTRRTSKIRISGWGGVGNAANDYTCAKTSP